MDNKEYSAQAKVMARLAGIKHRDAYRSTTRRGEWQVANG